MFLLRIASSAAPRWLGLTLKLVGALLQQELDVYEVRPVVGLLLPAFQHDLVEKAGAFVRCLHPVSVLHFLIHFLIVKSWWRGKESRGEKEKEKDCRSGEDLRFTQRRARFLKISNWQKTYFIMQTREFPGPQFHHQALMVQHCKKNFDGCKISSLRVSCRQMCEKLEQKY